MPASTRELVRKEPTPGNKKLDAIIMSGMIVSASLVVKPVAETIDLPVFGSNFKS